MLSLLLLLVTSGAAGAANTALDDVCAVLGGYYVTPEACASALCHDPSSSPCATARDAHAVAALAARLAAANATAARDSVRAAAAGEGQGAAAAAAKKKAGLLSCLQLYTGAAAALEWAAGSVAAGRYPGAREVLEAARYVPSGCDGMAAAAGAAVPPENGGFDAMVTVAHAIVASLSKGY
jgi:pectinesterase inhibitor-like protein